MEDNNQTGIPDDHGKTFWKEPFLKCIDVVDKIMISLILIGKKEKSIFGGRSISYNI